MKHEKHFKVTVYSNMEITGEEFNGLVMEVILGTEQRLNNQEDYRLRWHVTELTEAD